MLWRASGAQDKYVFRNGGKQPEGKEDKVSVSNRNDRNGEFGVLSDPGFSESDIKASIEDAAQGHVKWIYDCILARWDDNNGLRIGQAERRRLRAVALHHYRSYVEAVVARMEAAN
ncbi:MAG: hypothetical protein WC043_06585 [Pseudobdellovibrionaceae bacterium]